MAAGATLCSCPCSQASAGEGCFSQPLTAAGCFDSDTVTSSELKASLATIESAAAATAAPATGVASVECRRVGASSAIGASAAIMSSKRCVRVGAGDASEAAGVVFASPTSSASVGSASPSDPRSRTVSPPRRNTARARLARLLREAVAAAACDAGPAVSVAKDGAAAAAAGARSAGACAGSLALSITLACSGLSVGAAVRSACCTSASS